MLKNNTNEKKHRTKTEETVYRNIWCGRLAFVLRGELSQDLRLRKPSWRQYQTQPSPMSQQTNVIWLLFDSLALGRCILLGFLWSYILHPTLSIIIHHTSCIYPGAVCVFFPRGIRWFFLGIRGSKLGLRSFARSPFVAGKCFEFHLRHVTQILSPTILSSLTPSPHTPPHSIPHLTPILRK